MPGGAEGNQIRKVVKIMDGTISEVLQSGGATVDLELWRVHARNILSMRQMKSKYLHEQ